MRTMILLFFSMLLLSCNSSDSQNTTEKDINKKQINKLTPINYNDANYTDLAALINDTVTKSGWNLKYFVQDDSTKFNDLYLQWSNGSRKSVYKMEGVLQMRRYFIPTLVGENDNFIFLEHGCATDCSAVLVLGKDSLPTSIDYSSIIKYNIPLGEIVYITKQSWEHEEDYFEIAVVDLNKNKEYKEKFDNLCFGKWQYKPSCIDTIIFAKNTVTIKASLIDKKNREKSIEEMRVIKLNY